MYNEEKKQEYIKENKDRFPGNYLENNFKRIGDIEEAFGKDVALFNVAEITDLYKFLSFEVLEVLRMLNSQLGLYTQWYCGENSTNHYREISLETLLGCLNTSTKRLFTRQEILSIIRDLDNAVDKFFLLGLFEGIKGMRYCEMINARTRDIDEEKGRMHLVTGRCIDISRELIIYAKEAAMADVYIGKERNVALKPDRDLIIKERINAQDETKDEQKARRMSVKFDNLRKELNFPTNIRANQIVESGKVDFVRNYCRKLDIAPEEFFKDSILKKSLYKQYSIKEMNTNTFLLKNKEYLEI